MKEVESGERLTTCVCLQALPTRLKEAWVCMSAPVPGDKGLLQQHPSTQTAAAREHDRRVHSQGNDVAALCVCVNTLVVGGVCICATRCVYDANLSKIQLVLQHSRRYLHISCFNWSLSKTKTSYGNVTPWDAKFTLSWSKSLIIVLGLIQINIPDIRRI